jgi:hypothetical protein
MRRVVCFQIPTIFLIHGRINSGNYLTYIWLSMDQIPAEMMGAGGKTVNSQFHNVLVLFGIRKNCLSNDGIYCCAYLQG